MQHIELYWKDFWGWFWNDEFWLPKGMSFKDFQNKPGVYYPKTNDLGNMITVAICLTFARLLYERAIFKVAPMNFKQAHLRKRPEENLTLEHQYNLNKQPSDEKVSTLAFKLHWSTRSVQRWFRKRRNANKPSILNKLTESTWRCIFYLIAFSFGVGILLQSPWLWDNLHCFSNYPFQSLWPSVFYYYILEGGFYISLVFTLLRDVRRKDFVEQIVHHLATLGLIIFSYVTNLVRIGTLVLALCDISDVFLEAGKSLHYVKFQKSADLMFVLFAVVFFLSRVVAFPVVVIHTAYVKSMWLAKPYPGYYVFNALLLVLQILNIMWAATIFRMAIDMKRKGKVEKDGRSGTEESLDDEDE
ncbi:unnamed protein product [Clavelina lepadiformis]|uniref:Uncharacterized protein n=1 Tax=Clavelina lepadiformis TaxID=159417 RepID=A0ABP0GK64_CLALP